MTSFGLRVLIIFCFTINSFCRAQGVIYKYFLSDSTITSKSEINIGILKACMTEQSDVILVTSDTTVFLFDHNTLQVGWIGWFKQGYLMKNGFPYAGKTLMKIEYDPEIGNVTSLWNSGLIMQYIIPDSLSVNKKKKKELTAVNSPILLAGSYISDFVTNSNAENVFSCLEVNIGEYHSSIYRYGALDRKSKYNYLNGLSNRTYKAKDEHLTRQIWGGVGRISEMTLNSSSSKLAFIIDSSEIAVLSINKKIEFEEWKTKNLDLKYNPSYAPIYDLEFLSDDSLIILLNDKISTYKIKGSSIISENHIYFKDLTGPKSMTCSKDGNMVIVYSKNEVRFFVKQEATKRIKYDDFIIERCFLTHGQNEVIVVGNRK